MKRTINDAALSVIKEFEGFRAEAYLDTLAKPPVWTIGYGTTARAGVGITPKAGMVISEQEAAEYLRKTVADFGEKVEAGLKRPANDNQFGAMVSLAYNIGPGAFLGSSVLRRFNSGDERGAADAFLMWNKAGGKVLRGLERRRKVERDLFLTPVSTKPAPVEHPVSTPVALEPLARPAPSGFWAAVFAWMERISK